jgi:hypothetical protein
LEAVEGVLELETVASVVPVAAAAMIITSVLREEPEPQTKGMLEEMVFRLPVTALPVAEAVLAVLGQIPLHLQ